MPPRPLRGDESTAFRTSLRREGSSVGVSSSGAWSLPLRLRGVHLLLCGATAAAASIVVKFVYAASPGLYRPPRRLQRQRGEDSGFCGRRACQRRAENALLPPLGRFWAPSSCRNSSAAVRQLRSVGPQAGRVPSGISRTRTTFQARPSFSIARIAQLVVSSSHHLCPCAATR